MRWFDVAGVVFIMAALLFLGCLLPFEIGFHLLFGWVLFLMRVWPKVRLDPAGTATALVCLVGLTVGLHWFARWLYDAVRDPEKPAWRWSWTGMILGLVVLLFVAGIAAVGIAHQVGWLARGPGSIASISGGSREVRARAGSATNLKQIGLAAHNHHDTTMTLPPGGTFDAQGNALHGWQTLLLPYVEREDLLKKIDLQQPWNAPKNAGPFREDVSCYHHPAGGEQRDAHGFSLSHYAANVHVLNGGKPRTFKDIPDGTSNTILAGEVWAHYRPWGHPTNWRDPGRGIHTTPDSFGSPLGVNSVQFLMADGTVRFVRKPVSRETLQALATPDGGDKPGNDW